MKICVIGSSSDANGYVLQSDGGQAIVLECGCHLASVKRVLGYRVAQIQAIFVTHEHGDHAGFVNEYLNDTNAPIYTGSGTIEALKEKGSVGRKTRREPTTIEHGQCVLAGEFSVTAILLKSSNGNLTHDAAEPMAYVVSHPEMGRMMFATDTYCIPFSVRGLNHILIECNFDNKILDERYDAGKVDEKRRKRTIESHMSLENCKIELCKMDLSNVLNILLIHMSKDNGDADRFRREVSQSCRRHVDVVENGKIYELNITPF